MSSIQARTIAGQAVAVTVSDGAIRAVELMPGLAPEALPYVAPGLIDLQVNGYSGVDFNTLPLEAERVVECVGALRRTGVTGILPTIVTNAPGRTGELLAAFSALVERDEELREMVIGYHLEGPFISREDGPRGAHPGEFVMPPDLGLVKRWQEAARGGIRLLTMSPEWPGSGSFIAGCVAMGIRVAIGHSAASCGQIAEAVRAGATLSTHLGNACALHLHRHHNIIWQQLAEDDLWVSLIADGFHLPAAVLKTCLAAKRSRSILISDATCFGGMEPGAYRSHIGGDVALSSHGRLSIAGNEDYLAGSALPVLSGIDHLVRSGLCELDEAWGLASGAPAAYLGLADRGGLVPGMRADLVLFRREDGQTRIESVFVRGGEIR